MRFQLVRFFSTSSVKPPLHKVRVVDLSRILVGPYATQILGDFGAEVIKVEPFEGDETRKWGPPYFGDETTYYLSINRNKKSIAVNLKKGDGRKLIEDLVSLSDVFIENFGAGVTERLGLDYKSLKAINPQIIYSSISGFGTLGPLVEVPAFDPVVQGMSGLMHITGPKDGSPSKVGVAITDVLSGLHITTGILAALYHKSITGEGQLVQTSLLECSISSLVNIASAYLNGGANPRRIGNDHPSIVPFGAYPVKDGNFVMVNAGTDKQFQAFCKVIGREELSAHPDFSNNKKRVENRESLNAILNEVLSGWNAEELIRKMNEAKVPGGPINDMRKLFEMKQVKDLGVAQEVQGVKNAEGQTLRLVKSPLNFSKTPVRGVSKPPSLNENKIEILSGILGYDEEKIKKLEKDGVIL